MSPPAYLIDTDWVIDHLNGIHRVTSRLIELDSHGLALSVVSLAELWEGVHFSKDPARSEKILQEFVGGVAVLGLDEETCKLFGRLRGTLRQQGRLTGDFDLLIAATALRHDLTLLTNNRRHYENISGLRLESIGA